MENEIENNYNSMLANYPDILEVEDLQQIFNIGKNQAYGLVNSNQIVSFKMGRIHKIPKANVIAYIRQYQVA